MNTNLKSTNPDKEHDRQQESLLGGYMEYESVDQHIVRLAQASLQYDSPIREIMHKFLFIYTSLSFRTILNDLVVKCFQNLKEILHTSIKTILKEIYEKSINRNRNDTNRYDFFTINGNFNNSLYFNRFVHWVWH